MNLILLGKSEIQEIPPPSPRGDLPHAEQKQQFQPELIASLSIKDERAKHIRVVLKKQTGDSVKIGFINGKIGTALVEWSDDHKTLKLFLDKASLHEPIAHSEKRVRLKLVLAMPRPKALNRLLFDLAVLGVDEVVIVRAAKVEQSYFSSKHLRPAKLRKQLVLGLMQAAVDTHLPHVIVDGDANFESVLGRELGSVVNGDSAGDDIVDGRKTGSGKNCTVRVFAHPSATGGDDLGVADCIREEMGKLGKDVTGMDGAVELVVAIGSEGGWVDSEVETLRKFGFVHCQLGRRILTTHLACVTALTIARHTAKELIIR